MGNSGSRRHHNRYPAPSPAPPILHPSIATNQYVVTALNRYPPFPHPNPYPPGYYPPAGASPVPVGFHSYPGGAPPPPPPPVEHQKTITIRNDVNVRKESVRVEEDEENPGKFLVAFTFDATAAGSITVVFFAKEEEDCKLVAMKEDLLKPVTVSFQQGIGQKFRQPPGTGIDFSVFEDSVLRKEDDEGVYPLAIKADACTSNDNGAEANLAGNSQITLAVFDRKERGESLVRVMKQVLWVNGKRYELHEIYGIGNSVDVESDGNSSGKECVICMSEPRNTTVLPCRHMCMCSGCAKALQTQTNRCPICRQPIQSLLEIEVNDGTDK